MLRKLMRIVSALTLCLGSAACGPISNFTSADETKETVFAVDGVKLISSNILRGDDEATFGQRRYTIDSSSRLLLRFESLSAAQARIKTTQPIVIRVVADSASEKTKALTSLKACPLVRDWMMAATWTAAHPFKGGEWAQGSALADDDCVSAMASGTGPAACTSEGNAVCFDITAWYRSFLVEQGINFGHALVSADGQSVSLVGDAAGSRGPRIHWSE